MEENRNNDAGAGQSNLKSTLPRPGSIELTSIALSNFDGSETMDIRPIVMEFSIYEAIDQHFMRADVVMQDALSLLTRLPLVGEEQIQFKFRTPPETDGNNGKYGFIELGLVVHKLENMSPSNIRSGIVKLECVSNYKFASDAQIVQDALGPEPISEMAKKIGKKMGLTPGEFTGGQVGNPQDLGKDKNFFVEETAGKHQFAIPTFSPARTMDFLCSEAQSKEHIASNFVFFERHNTKGSQSSSGEQPGSDQGQSPPTHFFFTTIDRLIKEQRVQEQYYVFEQSRPEGSSNNSTGEDSDTSGDSGNDGVQDGGDNSNSTTDSNNPDSVLANKANSRSWRTMYNLEFFNLFDVEKNRILGLYDNTVLVIDPLLQKFYPVPVGKKSTFNYLENFDKFQHIAKPKEGQQTSTGFPLCSPKSTHGAASGTSHIRMLITNKDQADLGGFEVYARKRPEFLPYLISSSRQLDHLVCNFMCPGDSNRKPGDLIWFNYHEIGGTDDILKELNKYISGAWMVWSVRHKFTHGETMPFVSILSCVKNVYEKEIANAPIEVGEPPESEGSESSNDQGVEQSQQGETNVPANILGALRDGGVNV